MAIRVRPATTLAVVLGIALGFHIVALVSVPITSSITLCTYDTVKFGVFGLCTEDGTCTSPGIGYSDDDISDLSGFSLPSNARHSVSKLLIVHPIAAGFTAILFFASILLHWHGPSTSMKLLFFLLLWTMPAFLLTLLSFLVDILLFVPHLDWGGWIIFASTVLIALSAILLCIMRRTVSSRKAIKMHNMQQNGNDYQLAPLNYGYGTVDAGSAYKLSTNSNKGDDDEDAPFVHGGDYTYNADDSMHYNDMNSMAQTQAFDSLRGGSAQSNPSYRNSDILTQPPNAYRGYEYTPPTSAPLPEADAEADTASIPDYTRSASEPVPQPTTVTPQSQHIASPSGQSAVLTPTAQSISLTSPAQTAPYPSEIPMVMLSDIPEVATSAAPYPTDNGILPKSRLTGPRPMSMTPRSSTFPTEVTEGPFHQDDDWGFTNDEPSAPPLPQEDIEQPTDINGQSALTNVAVERNPTYRTRIAQGIEALQPSVYSSTDSFADTQEDLLASSNRQQRNIGEITTDGEDTTFDQSNDITESGDEDDLYQSSQHDLRDDASSAYSSQVPSTINTPIDTRFPHRQPSVLQQSQIPEDDVLSSDVIRALGNPDDNYTPSEVTLDDYPFPDPNALRTTPAPSFSNESIGSSTFTSVSQRGINPRYFEKNPDEYVSYVQRQNMMQRGIHTQQRPMQAQTTSDVLIASNPDFSIGVKKPKRRGPAGTGI